MMDSEASDEQLVRLAAAGDKAAFTRLVGRHQHRLLALVTRSLGSRAAAEDVVQEVFTRAWMNAPNWSARDTGGASYAAWLSRVAVNLCIDGFRRHRPTAPIEGIAEPADPSPTADVSLLRRETAARVRAAIGALPDRQRMAIALTYDADITNPEGAAAMGTSVGSFELLLVRARRTLRLALQDGHR